MKIHFISIGGSVMHNMAISLHKKGMKVTGSDDEIFEPSKSRLKKHGLLPEKNGWDETRINSNIDVVILGMHARIDNPELIKAKKLKLKIYSFPEYFYEQTKNKLRVVIGGSHGKTTITSMVMHVLNYHKIKFDYLVGAKLEGFETMVELSNESTIAIFEGDEYLSSPIDKRPKFHLYKPHIALITGIAWDHINVFPTFKIYKKQFEKFIELIEKNGTLIYYKNDKELSNIVKLSANNINKFTYNTQEHKVINGKTFLKYNNQLIPVEIFGNHNLQNINGARLVCNKVGIDDKKFYKAITSFKGASKRLQLLNKNDFTNIYIDFAHSPSKLEATVTAVKEQFANRKLIACMELHTFSSLNKNFLEQYSGTMDLADIAIIYYNPETVSHKKLENISKDEIKKAFGRSNINVYINSNNLIEYIKSLDLKNKNLLLMSSGNFSGIDLVKFASDLL
ncbi:MAG: peptidoglycan synthetase [Bacteroidales bacterium]|nr:peptidoglycan synthetase [Bacteroidales bacterium]